MKVRAILNPRAGIAARKALVALEAVRGMWPDLEVLITTRAGDARAWSEEAAANGSDLVLSIGGDGTANEAAWGLLGSRTALGLLPMGSGNGLARVLGLSLNPRRAIDQLAQAVRRRIDVGLVNGRPFFNVAGAGFDAAVGAAFHRRGQEGGRRGVLTYVKLGLGMAFGYRSETWRLAVGPDSYEGAALIVAFLNGRQYGGGAVVAPRALLDDGLLDVVVIEDAPRMEILWNAPRVFWNSIEGFGRYRHFRGREALLTGSGPIGHHRDGEPEPGVPNLHVTLAPSALEVLVPRGCAEDPEGPFSGTPRPAPDTAAPPAG
jgi:YegS/Rv2252/BmrU family lipid kinase